MIDKADAKRFEHRLEQGINNLLTAREIIEDMINDLESETDWIIDEDGYTVEDVGPTSSKKLKRERVIEALNEISDSLVGAVTEAENVDVAMVLEL